MGIHPAVMSFLDIKRSYFHSIETTIDGKNLVTPRGWEDLSKMIHLFEKNGLTVDEDLIIQYLQNRKITKEFSVYYDLFKKYKEDYQVKSIIEGKPDGSLKKKALKASFDERLSLVGLLLDGVGEGIREVIEGKEYLLLCMNSIKEYKRILDGKKTTPQQGLVSVIDSEEKALLSLRNSGALSVNEKIRRQKCILFLRELSAEINDAENGETAYKVIKQKYNQVLKVFKKKAELSKKQLSNMFKFCEEVFGDGQEMLIVVTELTANPSSAKFIGEFGCDEYFNHNKDLLFYERQIEIITKLQDLGL